MKSTEQHQERQRQVEYIIMGRAASPPHSILAQASPFILFPIYLSLFMESSYPFTPATQEGAQPNKAQSQCWP